VKHAKRLRKSPRSRLRVASSAAAPFTKWAKMRYARSEIYFHLFRVREEIQVMMNDRVVQCERSEQNSHFAKRERLAC